MRTSALHTAVFPNLLRLLNAQWAQGRCLLSGKMNQLTEVQLWSFQCIFNARGEPCLSGHVDLMMKQESKRGSCPRQPRLSFLSSLVSAPSFWASSFPHFYCCFHSSDFCSNLTFSKRVSTCYVKLSPQLISIQRTSLSIIMYLCICLYIL